MSDMGITVKAEEPKKPEQIRSEFEKRVRNAKTRAWWIAVMHVMLRYSGIWALTWATAILLGGFSADLSIYDFIFISVILAVESIRIFTIETITDILHRDRFSESSNPDEFLFKDQQEKEVDNATLMCQVVSAILSFVTLGCSGSRLIIRPVFHAHEILNLLCGLYVFDCLVFVTAVMALLHAYVRYSARHCYDKPEQNSLMYFHDEVYVTAIRVGLGEGDRLEILNFAFVKLATDFRRNIRAPLIQRQNRDLIRYLYHNQQGIAMVCEALKSPSDLWHQVVAANLPGFWVAEARIEKQLGLFWELAERMHGAGKDAEGALNSIRHLALSFAAKFTTKDRTLHPFLREDPTIDTGRSCIVSRLVRLVCNQIRPNLLFQIRALEACCQSSQVVEYLHGRRRSRQDTTDTAMTQAEGVAETELHELYDTFDQFLENKKIRGKIYVVSAWVALLSGGGDLEKRMKTFTEEIQNFPENLDKDHKSTDDLKKNQKKNYIWLKDDHKSTEALKKDHKNYIWLNDVLMVEGLRKILGMKEPPPNWRCVCIRSNEDAQEIQDEELKSEIRNYLQRRFSPERTNGPNVQSTNDGARR